MQGDLPLTARGAGIIADRAVALALEGRAGPVHIDVPIGVAAAEVPIGPGGAPEPHRAPASPLVPAGEDLETARAWLRHATNPVIVAGLDAVRDDAGAAILALAETLQAPVVTTYKAKGIVDETHPLALGGAGLSPLADRHVLPLLQEADVAILAGYDPIEMRAGWRDPFGPATRVIDIAHAPNTHYMHQGDLNFVAHVGETLALLREGLEPRSERTVEAKAALAADAFPHDDEWGPAGVIAEARAVLPAQHHRHRRFRRAPHPPVADVDHPRTANPAAIVGLLHHGRGRADGDRREARPSRGGWVRPSGRELLRRRRHADGPGRARHGGRDAPAGDLRGVRGRLARPDRDEAARDAALPMPAST